MVHVVTLATGASFNTGLATGIVPGVLDDWVLFSVRESDQGWFGTDLNGDGDTEDDVWHLYNAVTHTTTNLGLCARFAPVTTQQQIFFTALITNTGPAGPLVNLRPRSVDGDLVAMDVSESHQGQTDLNGDGDYLDVVVAVYNASNATVTNTGIATVWGTTIHGGWVATVVPEARHGNVDLNGDGDTDDYVLHYYDISAAVTTNSGLAIPTGLAPDLPVDGTLGRGVFAVSETEQGGVDLNGDGDSADVVLYSADLLAVVTDTDGDGIEDAVEEAACPPGTYHPTVGPCHGIVPIPSPAADAYVDANGNIVLILEDDGHTFEVVIPADMNVDLAAGYDELEIEVNWDNDLAAWVEFKGAEAATSQATTKTFILDIPPGPPLPNSVCIDDNQVGQISVEDGCTSPTAVSLPIPALVFGTSSAPNPGDPAITLIVTRLPGDRLQIEGLRYTTVIVSADSDGDGLFDMHDRCPESAGPPGFLGCPGVVDINPDTLNLGTDTIRVIGSP